MWIATRAGVLPCGDRARSPHDLLAVAIPRRHLSDQLGVEVTVLAGRDGQIPAVNQVVCSQLAEVLADVLFAVGKVHSTTCWQPLGDCRQSLLGCRDRCGRRVFSEQITVERISDFCNGLAIHQRLGPTIFPRDMIDERAYIPIGARCRPGQSSDRFQTVSFQNSTLRRYVFSSAIAHPPFRFAL